MGNETDLRISVWDNISNCEGTMRKDNYSGNKMKIKQPHNKCDSGFELRSPAQCKVKLIF